MPVTRAHHLRPRLRDLAQRAARGPGAAQRRRRGALPRGGGARPRRLQPLVGAALRPAALRGGRARLAAPPGSLRAAARRGLEKRKGEFDAVVFFTYLYHPTYCGLQAAPERSVLVPTAHDEPPLRFRIYDALFALPRALRLLLGAGVRAGALRGSGSASGPAAVTGHRGGDAGRGRDVEGFRIRHDVRGPYVLYAGRIDAGKGCEEMVAFYDRYRRDHRGRGGAAAHRAPGHGGAARPRRALPRLPLGGGEARGPGRRARGRLPEPLREPVHRPARGLRAGHARPGQRPLPGAEGPLRPLAGRPLLRGREEFGEAADLLVREPGCARPWARTAALRGGNYRWEAVLARYRAAIAAVAR